MELSDFGLGKELVALGLQKELDRVSSATAALDAELDTIVATAISPDRLIRVTVTARGDVPQLEFDPAIYDRQDAPALAAAILATLSEAQAAVAAKAAGRYDDFEERLS